MWAMYFFSRMLTKMISRISCSGIIIYKILPHAYPSPGWEWTSEQEWDALLHRHFKIFLGSIFMTP
jgi:hypothetical protein